MKKLSKILSILIIMLAVTISQPMTTNAANLEPEDAVNIYHTHISSCHVYHKHTGTNGSCYGRKTCTSSPSWVDYYHCSCGSDWGPGTSYGAQLSQQHSAMGHSNSRITGWSCRGQLVGTSGPHTHSSDPLVLTCKKTSSTIDSTICGKTPQTHVGTLNLYKDYDTATVYVELVSNEGYTLTPTAYTWSGAITGNTASVDITAAGDFICNVTYKDEVGSSRDATVQCNIEGKIIAYNKNETESNIQGNKVTTTATGSMESTVVIPNQTSYISYNTYEKEGYTFKEWNTKPDGSGTKYPVNKAMTFDGMSTFNLTLYAIWQPNTYYIDYTKGMSNNNGTTARTAHYFDADVTLAANNFLGRSYMVSFDGNEPEGTIGIAQNLPATKTGNLSFNKWRIYATYHDYTLCDEAVNLGVMNFESTQGAIATAAANWNNETITWTEEPTLVGYDFQGWAYASGRTVTSITITPTTAPYSNVIYATWSPRNDTKYQVKHWVQNITALSDEYNSTNFTCVETQSFTGTSDTYVTPAVNSYEGCISPQPIRIKIEADGSTVLNYYYERVKVSLDIDGEYLSTHYTNTASLATFDVYINDKQVANDVTDFHSDTILYGSTYKIKDINPIAGKHYSGSHIQTN